MRSSFVLAVLVGLLGLVCARPPAWLKHGDQVVYHKFSLYITDFGKSYESDAEKSQRFTNFKENMDKAAILNDLHNGTAEFGPTIFSDLTAAEFAKLYLSSLTEVPPANNETARLTVGSPTSHDWTAQGKVTAVKNQGSVCGSCWAYTALGEMESQLLMKPSPRNLELSVQQLVDCDPYNTGCQGGFYDRAWSYIFQAGGVMPAAEYAYQGAKYSCRFNKARVTTSLSTSGAKKPAGTAASQINDFVYSHGPSAAALDATPLQNYRSGVVNVGAGCTNLNHAVLITGYAPGSFTVRNSWGAAWGEKGYFRIAPTSCLINQHVMGSSVL